MEERRWEREKKRAFEILADVNKTCAVVSRREERFASGFHKRNGETST